MVEGTADNSAAAPASPGAAGARSKPQKKRSIWWRIHQWSGLQLSLFLAFVLLTGTLAVFSYELDWLTRPSMWAAPTAYEDRVSWGDVGAAVAEHDSDLEIVNLYAPLHPASTFDVIVRDGETLKHVYVHPRTGEVTGEGSWFGFQRFLRNAHRHLMLPVPIGVTLVSFAAVFLTASLVTSFWVYKKWWRGFTRWPKGRNARAFTGDLHRIAGVWSIWFIVLMIVTGFWYLIEQWGGAAPPASAAQAPAVMAEASPSPSLPGAPAALDAGIAALKAELPEYRIARVVWPREPGDDFQVHGWTGRAILVRPRANTAWINADTGALAGVVDPSALGVHTRIAEAADPLHFGTFGGYWTKTLWFLFGAALTGLSLTGAAIYALRIAKAERRETGWRRGLTDAWRAMGRLRWLSALLVVTPFALIPVLY